MRFPRFVAVLGLHIALSSTTLAAAAERTAVLNVDNATCALCGPIVKRALERVTGVISAEVTEADAFSGAVATVRFDDAVATTDALIAATTNAGYPSRLAE